MEKKYKLTKETTKVDEITLYRIEALKSFGDIKEGAKGGFIEKEYNLDHEGECWVYNNACVYQYAKVSGNAKVTGYSQIYNDARIYGNAVTYAYAKVYNDAKVYDFAQIYEFAEVFGNASIYEEASISGYAKVREYAQVHGHAQISKHAVISGCARIFNYAQVSGDAKVYENAQIRGNADISNIAQVYGEIDISGSTIIREGNFDTNKSYITIGPIGDISFITLEKESGMINAGGFSGTIEEFKEDISCKDDIDKDYYPIIEFLQKYKPTKKRQKKNQVYSNKKLIIPISVFKESPNILNEE